MMWETDKVTQKKKKKYFKFLLLKVTLQAVESWNVLSFSQDCINESVKKAFAAQ